MSNTSLVGSITELIGRVDSVCGDRPYPHHLFDSAEDIAYFHCADLSPLWRSTTQLGKVSVCVSLRGDTLHVKPVL